MLENDNGAKAIVRTYGGNTFTYITKDGIEVMGTRKDAVLNDAKPYAGGSPHCFPQFGPGAIMQHGFARGMKFIPEERAKKLSFDRMIFKLEPTEETLKVWDFDFEYRFDVTLRADCLEWDLIVINKGDKPFDITLGMHTYFDISSLKNVKVSGPFKGAASTDKVTGKLTTSLLPPFSGPLMPPHLVLGSKNAKNIIFWKLRYSLCNMLVNQLLITSS